MKKIVFALATLYVAECTVAGCHDVPPPPACDDKHATGCHYVPPPPACDDKPVPRSRKSVSKPIRPRISIPEFSTLTRPRHVSSVSISKPSTITRRCRPSVHLNYSCTLRKPQAPEEPSRPSLPHPRKPIAPEPSTVKISIRENSTGRKALSSSTSKGRSTSSKRTSRNSRTDANHGNHHKNHHDKSRTDANHGNHNENSRTDANHGNNHNEKSKTDANHGNNHNEKSKTDANHGNNHNEKSKTDANHGNNHNEKSKTDANHGNNHNEKSKTDVNHGNNHNEQSKTDKKCNTRLNPVKCPILSHPKPLPIPICDKPMHFEPIHISPPIYTTGKLGCEVCDKCKK